VESNKKKEWGGARKGSGNKPKYNEKTTTIAFRVPISKVDEVKEIIKNKQTQWKKVIQG
jgi:hypothetical protein